MTNLGLLIETGNYYAGRVCSECLMSLASTGDWSHLDDRALDTLQKYDITIGHIHSGVRCFHAGKECEEDCDCEQTDFAVYRCDVCNTDLAGYRQDVIMVKREDLT